MLAINFRLPRILESDLWCSIWVDHVSL